nr:MAG TPA: hypothetical protein [Caudoviricetes sp.]
MINRYFICYSHILYLLLRYLYSIFAYKRHIMT